jgi:hypothetical protein
MRQPTIVTVQRAPVMHRPQQLLLGVGAVGVVVGKGRVDKKVVDSTHISGGDWHSANRVEAPCETAEESPVLVQEGRIEVG